MTAGGPPRPLPRIHRLFPGVFYGWFIVFGSALLAFVAVGIGFYGQPVLLNGLVSERGWSLAQVSAASTLFFVVAGVVGPGVGMLIDRFGARVAILLGLGLMAVALVAVGHAGSPGELMPIYALLALGFALAGAIPSSALVTRWFVAHRSRAMAVSQTGVSLGGVLIVPLAALLMEREGIERATGWLALAVVALGVPVTLWVLRSDPEVYGLETDGDATAAQGNALLDPARQYRIWRAGEAVRTGAFLWLAVAFGCVLLGQVGLLIHALSFFNEELDSRQAAFAFSLMPGASVVGRLVVGGLFADRVDKRRLCIALFCVQALGLLAFGLLRGPAGLVAASLLFGLTIGNIFMMQSLLTGEIFGIPSFGTVFGLLQLVTQMAAGLGPLVVGLLHSALGGYAPTWLLLSGLSGFAIFALTRLRVPD
ncbi:MAG: MFS transporter [Deltaproteobacteria bacterium]|nr:MFS transporter [Deltaproteobacteria bacterium]MBW2415444.1 MFS transporter [Deltaproteobacteria bacterium]